MPLIFVVAPNAEARIIHFGTAIFISIFFARIIIIEIRRSSTKLDILTQLYYSDFRFDLFLHLNLILNVIDIVYVILISQHFLLLYKLPTIHDVKPLRKLSGVISNLYARDSINTLSLHCLLTFNCQDACGLTTK